jgi:cell division protein FtsL
MVLSAKVKKADKIVDMPASKKKQKPRKKLKYKLSGPGLFFLIILGFIFYSFAGQMVEMYNVQGEMKNIKAQMQELQAKNVELRKQVEQLSSDAYIEREAREKLGLVKPGEKIILEAKPGAAGSDVPVRTKKTGNSEVH